MADHRAEQILAALVTKLTGLTTTGANAFRGRADDEEIPVENTPAIGVFMGSDLFVEQYSQALKDFDLLVHLRAVVATNAQQVDTVLNQIRKEVVAALLADPTLGLPFVLDTVEGDADEPELDASSAVRIARQSSHFTVRYRRAYADPSA